MAHHDGSIFSDFGHDNHNSQNDGHPGGPGESAEYAHIYDVNSATEYTNRPETATQLLVAQRELNDAAIYESGHHHIREARSSVQFFPDVGKFIIPKENTWAAHIELIRDPTQKLGFDPARYPYFDAIVAKHFPQIMDPKYDGIRDTVAVLRNDIIGMYLNDGSFDPGDEKYIPYIAGVAHAIGELLANGAIPRRWFFPHVDARVANEEGVGAREIYKHLIAQQVAPSYFNVLKVQFGAYDRSWGLPPLEATPYSETHLSAPPPAKPVYVQEAPSSRFRDSYLNERGASVNTPLKGW